MKDKKLLLTQMNAGSWWSRKLAWCSKQNMASLAAFILFTAGNAYLGNSLTWLLMEKGLAEDVSIFYGITGLVPIFTLLFSGKLVDLWGPRKLVIRFLPIWCTIPFFYVWVDQLWALVGVRLIHDFVMTAITSSLYVQFMESVPKEQSKEANSFSLASEYIVISMGIPLGAWLLASEYLVEWGSIPLVCGLVILLIVSRQQDMPIRQKKVTEKEQNTIKQNWWEKTKEFFRSVNWELILLNSSLVAIPLTNAMYGRYLPLYIPGMWSAWLLAIQTITSAFSGWLVIKIIKGWTKYKVLQVVHGIHILCLFVTWGFSHVVPIMIASMVLLGWSSSAFLLGYMQVQYEEAPQEKKGKQSSLNSLPAKISMPIGHWGSGPIVGHWGYGAVWWMIVPFHLFGVLAKLRFVRKTK